VFETLLTTIVPGSEEAWSQSMQGVIERTARIAPQSTLVGLFYTTSGPLHAALQLW
jgi:hypothetical protein